MVCIFCASMKFPHFVNDIANVKQLKLVVNDKLGLSAIARVLHQYNYPSYSNIFIIFTLKKKKLGRYDRILKIYGVCSPSSQDEIWIKILYSKIKSLVNWKLILFLI